MIRSVNEYYVLRLMSPQPSIAALLRKVVLTWRRRILDENSHVESLS